MLEQLIRDLVSDVWSLALHRNYFPQIKHFLNISLQTTSDSGLVMNGFKYVPNLVSLHSFEGIVPLKLFYKLIYSLEQDSCKLKFVWFSVSQI